MAMMDDEPLFVDTNILVYATDPRSPLQPLAAEALRQAREAGVPLVVSPQILREYVAVASRPATAGGGIPIDDILDNVDSFRSAFRILEEGSAGLDQLVLLIRQIPIAGRRVHDTNLVATMLAHGVRRLLTHNINDFARYDHLITVVPLEPPIQVAGTEV